MGRETSKIFEPEARWVDEKTAFFRCSCGLSMFGPLPELFDHMMKLASQMVVPAMDWYCPCGQVWILPLGLQQVDFDELGESDV